MRARANRKSRGTKRAAENLRQDGSTPGGRAYKRFSRSDRRENAAQLAEIRRSRGLLVDANRISAQSSRSGAPGGPRRHRGDRHPVGRSSRDTKLGWMRGERRRKGDEGRGGRYREIHDACR